MPQVKPTLPHKLVAQVDSREESGQRFTGGGKAFAVKDRKARRKAARKQPRQLQAQQRPNSRKFTLASKQQSYKPQRPQVNLSLYSGDMHADVYIQNRTLNMIYRRNIKPRVTTPRSVLDSMHCWQSPWPSVHASSSRRCLRPQGPARPNFSIPFLELGSRWGPALAKASAALGLLSNAAAPWWHFLYVPWPGS